MVPEKIALITDSCADLSRSLIEQYDIHVVPLRIQCNDGEYRDGVDIFPQDIYQRLHAGELPKTSLPRTEDIAQVITGAVRAGYDGAIAVMLSSALSGTFNLMHLAGEEAGESFPIRVFDSMSGSLGYGMIVLQLAEDIKAGMGWEELTHLRCPHLIQNTHPFFSVDTLEYLMKGGRIGRVTATTGTLLKIKPILGFNEVGELHNVAKVRGNAQVIERLVELVVKELGSHTHYNIAMANGGNPAGMEILRGKLTTALPDYDHFWWADIDSTLSTYIGDGVLGAAVQLLD